jgi:hypothetical protein
MAPGANETVFNGLPEAVKTANLESGQHVTASLKRGVNEIAPLP